MDASFRTRRSGVLIFAAASFALASIVESAAVAAPRIDYAELYVIYTGSTAIQVKFNGNIIRSGAVIPAGLYAVVVYDEGDNLNPRFVMTGPGVSISSDLNPSGMGLQSVTFGPYTFPTNASYRIEDTNLGASSVVTFTTSATSSGSGSGGSSGGSSGGTQPSGANATSARSSAKLLGTLKASVSASGKPTLTFGGKTPKALKAGRYTVTATDQSRTAGLIVGAVAKPAITISGGSAVGTRTRTVTLTVGKWFFAPSTSGKKTYFTVVE